jgi:hypothetical protein
MYEPDVLNEFASLFSHSGTFSRTMIKDSRDSGHCAMNKTPKRAGQKPGRTISALAKGKKIALRTDWSLSFLEARTANTPGRHSICGGRHSACPPAHGLGEKNAGPLQFNMNPASSDLLRPCC